MPLPQFWFFPVPISISKASTTCRNVESVNAPCKPHFWLAGSFLPPWVPGTLLQLLVGFPVPSGNSSGSPVLPLFLFRPPFPFSATASLVPGKDSPEFSPSSKIARSTLTLNLNSGGSNKRYMVITEYEVL